MLRPFAYCCPIRGVKAVKSFSPASRVGIKFVIAPISFASDGQLKCVLPGSIRQKCTTSIRTTPLSSVFAHNEGRHIHLNSCKTSSLSTGQEIVTRLSAPTRAKVVLRDAQESRIRIVVETTFSKIQMASLNRFETLGNTVLSESSSLFCEPFPVDRVCASQKHRQLILNYFLLLMRLYSTFLPRVKWLH